MKAITVFLWLITGSLVMAESPLVVSAKPQDGVFFTYTGYMTTVLELKEGHFRYWFESDLKLPKEPVYPLTGKFSIMGDVLTLKGEQISQPEWTIQSLDGVITLWRPDALSGYPFQKSFNVELIKKFGGGSILVLSDKSAEDLWKHRGPPSL